MKSSCANCESPSRVLWALFGAKRKPILSTVVDGNWISLERCETCSILWCASSYEPYASFPFLVAWSGDETSWKKMHNVDDGKTLLQWHARAVATTWSSVSAEEKNAISTFRERSCGRNPIDDPASFQTTTLQS